MSAVIYHAYKLTAFVKRVKKFKYAHGIKNVDDRSYRTIGIVRTLLTVQRVRRRNGYDDSGNPFTVLTYGIEMA